ncbi:ABC transporter ATP-binding protein [Calothrix sp. UHCC 0171]|uniref:ABC transporter ATP-binding protein n=1 Tax=Calothrix sp. UHCC 0171 TaxID=3110245 RepID=UPI002B21F2B5|nr:ABC transporter ATP-binding protein [Calothrix sp. UHCC 0171]MEA5569881.1 ABC transporter ATP-binding protein [Calothrix sp. UHCC 0171]
MIEVEHLSKIYGSTAAITDVTFNVEEGEILGFLGPNGAGKTTTMRILSGYLPATNGTAKIAGFDVHENSLSVRQRIGYLPENPPLYPEMTIEGFLDFVARIKGVPAGDRPEKVKIALEKCNLSDRRHTIIRKLSKGYKQRVGIAQAIVHDPPAIILDEPTVGLDPRQIIDVRNLIKSLAGSHTIVLSTHILPEVSMTCNRIAIINKGKVVATNTPENLMTQLTGGSGYELEISGEANLAKQVLQQLVDVILVESIPTVGANGIPLPQNRTCLRVITQPGSEPGSDIAAILLQAGFQLYEMRRVSATLEDVFLQLTTEEKTLEIRETEESTVESTETAEGEGE